MRFLLFHQLLANMPRNNTASKRTRDLVLLGESLIPQSIGRSEHYDVRDEWDHTSGVIESEFRPKIGCPA